MIKAVLRYIPRAVLDLCADGVALVTAPILAACVRREGDRYYLWRPLRDLATHDTDLTAWWRGSYDSGGWFKRRFTQEDYDRSKMVRWYARVKWIWRNPAYGVSHRLGYDQSGVDTTRGLYKDPLWDSGRPNKAFWKVVNSRGQVGFLYQCQAYWGKSRRCVEMQFGWKLYRRDPDRRCMIAVRFHPFKKYELKEV